MISIAKIFNNDEVKHNARHPLISRTFAKVGVISELYEPPSGSHGPRHAEFWWVRISQETFSRHRQGVSGVFVLDPIKPVKDNRTMDLLPGMYDHVVEEGILVIRPRQNLELPWIIPSLLRRRLMRKYDAHACIVDLSPPDLADMLNQQTTTERA